MKSFERPKEAEGTLSHIIRCCCRNAQVLLMRHSIKDCMVFGVIGLFVVSVGLPNLINEILMLKETAEYFVKISLLDRWIRHLEQVWVVYIART